MDVGCGASVSHPTFTIEKAPATRPTSRGMATTSTEGGDMPERICSVRFCDGPAHALGLCKRCHEYRRTHGTAPSAIACVKCGCKVVRVGMRCRDCRLADRRERYREDPDAYVFNWRRANRDQVREHARLGAERRRQRDPGYNNRWAIENREKAQRWRRTWRKTTEAGRTDVRNGNERRRHSKYTPAAIEYIAVLGHDPCSYCGGRMRTIDHVTPVASGGSGEWDNLTAACGSCNSSKGTRRLLRFMLVRKT